MALFLLVLLPFLITCAFWMVWWLTPEQPLRTLFVEMDMSRPPVIIRGASHEWALIIPVGLSAVTDRVWHFDTKSGTATAIETPTRVAAVSTSPAHHSNNWWAWADRDGRVHVMSLPEGKELWQAPPNPRLLIRADYLASLDGRYLLIPYTENGPFDIWEIATGVKLGSLDNLSEYRLRVFRFDTLGRLIIVGIRDDLQKARILSYELLSGQLVKQVDLPCPSTDTATLLDDNHCVFGDSFASGQWWDISTNPPRRTGPPSPLRMLKSKDGRYSVTENSIQLFDWSLIECATNRTIVFSGDPRISHLYLPAPRAQPAFSADGRFLKLNSFRVRMFPNWMPSWLKGLLITSGLKEAYRELFLIDTSTGQVSRRLPGDELLLAPENSDFVWTMSHDPARSNGLTGSQWPLAAPGPPWWLWTLTACVGAWYVWRRVRVFTFVTVKSTS